MVGFIILGILLILQGIPCSLAGFVQFMTIIKNARYTDDFTFGLKMFVALLIIAAGFAMIFGGTALIAKGKDQLAGRKMRKISLTPTRCPNCHEKLPTVARICMHCGYKLPIAKPGNTVRCPKCNHIMNENSKFCDRCGTQLAATNNASVCPVCKKPIMVNDAFCSCCGTKL